MSDILTEHDPARCRLDDCSICETLCADCFEPLDDHCEHCGECGCQYSECLEEYEEED